MDNTIYPISTTDFNQRSHNLPANAAKTKRALRGFARAIAESVNNSAKKTVESPQHKGDEKKQTLFIGEINKNSPTVSHLLVKNSQVGNKSWDIIHSQINSNKPYTKVRTGTEVFLNPATNEIFLGSKEASLSVKEEENISSTSSSATEITLGSLGSDSPTISHLLAQSPEFSDQKWQILSLPVNAGKDFRHIPGGSAIHINTATKEISWSAPHSSIAPAALYAEEKPPISKEKTENLSTAVQQFIGTPYSKIDCYDLVVKGLQNIGIQYGGKTGLYRHLTKMAKARGLPANAYLTGEGLVAAAGSRVLYEAFPVVKKPDIAAQQTLEKMSGLLERGQILSFSTPTRGHTGIIYRDPWHH